MNEIANELAAATLRQIEENGKKMSRDILEMIKRTGNFARYTNGECEEVKKLVELLKKYAIRLIQNEKGPRQSGWTSEVLGALRYGFLAYLCPSKQ